MFLWEVNPSNTSRKWGGETRKGRKPWLLSKLAPWALGFVPTGEVWEPVQKTPQNYPTPGPRDGVWKEQLLVLDEGCPLGDINSPGREAEGLHHYAGGFKEKRQSGGVTTVEGEGQRK